MERKEQGSNFLYFSVMIAAIGGFLFGYHTGVISGALTFVSAHFQLSTMQEALFVTMVLIGALFGALIAGTLADKIGRKPTISITSVLFIIGTSMIASSQDFLMLFLGRAVTGLGVGIVSLAVPLYLAEISPPHQRGRCVSSNQLAVTLGILVSFIVNYFLSETGSWRFMFAIGAFPALFQMFALFFLLESPAWLFKNHFYQHAVLNLGRLRKDTLWENQLSEMKHPADLGSKGQWKTLFAKPLRSLLLIGILLSAFQQITGINTVIYYAPKIFQSAGFASTSGAILATLGVGSINVLTTIFSVWLLDKLGRRRLLLIGVAGMIISLSLLSFSIFSKLNAIDIMAVLCLMGYVCFFAIGLGPVTWVLLSEIYPLKMRAKAMTLATFANWLCNTLVSFTFLDLIAGVGVEGAFLIYAMISVLAFCFIYRLIPETKGKSLEEIERQLL